MRISTAVPVAALVCALSPAATAQIGFDSLSPSVVRNTGKHRIAVRGNALDRVHSVAIGGRACEIVEVGPTELTVLLDVDGLQPGPFGVTLVDLRREERYHRERALFVVGHCRITPKRASYAYGDRLTVTVPGVPDDWIGLAATDFRILYEQVTPRSFAIGVLDPQVVTNRAVLRIEVRGEPVDEVELNLVRVAAPKPRPELLDAAVVGCSAATFSLRGIPFTFRCVPAQASYHLGLTVEQAHDVELVRNGFADTSAHKDGAVRLPLLHPFLIQETEVSSGAYLAFLRASGAPAENAPESLRPYLAPAVDGAPLPELPAVLARLPVTGVNYYDAVAFARWLNEDLSRQAPGWTVRLPHEVEWEMAARGSDARRFVFPDHLDIEVMGVELPAEPQPVGGNRGDVSWCGVLDLCANVSEITASRFVDKLLPLIAFRLSSGDLEGWDPRDPFAAEILTPLPDGAPPPGSHPTCVRGGSYGEAPAMLQVSVRREQECHVAYPTVGFRLLIVGDPKGGRVVR